MGVSQYSLLCTNACTQTALGRRPKEVTDFRHCAPMCAHRENHVQASGYPTSVHLCVCTDRNEANDVQDMMRPRACAPMHAHRRSKVKTPGSSTPVHLCVCTETIRRVVASRNHPWDSVHLYMHTETKKSDVQAIDVFKTLRANARTQK